MEKVTEILSQILAVLTEIKDLIVKIDEEICFQEEEEEEEPS